MKDLTQYSFLHNGKTYRGYIMSSGITLPRFYWFCFYDNDLIQSVGDAIGFKEEDENSFHFV